MKTENIELKKLFAAAKGFINITSINNEVAKQWRKKAICLNNLTNENKHELKNLDLKLIGGLKYGK